jgi:XTP/dITP diphosphohydrolase
VTIVVATHNRGKAAEFAHLLGDAVPGVEWIDLSAFPDIGEVDETGDTFEANARLKASGYAQRTGHWCLADDSGLCVDALDGKPGVVSARWAALHQAGQGDAANNALLLKQLDGVSDPDRTARFECVLALSDSTGRIVLASRGTMDGHIIRSPRGTNGFGYDPLFVVAELNKTTAELSPAEKAAVSHRGRALRQLAGGVAAVLAEGKS